MFVKDCVHHLMSRFTISGTWILSQKLYPYSNMLALTVKHQHFSTHTVDSRYYDISYNEILLIMVPNLYPNHSQPIEIQTGYMDSLFILIHFPYPISMVITRVYCISFSYNF